MEAILKGANVVVPEQQAQGTVEQSLVLENQKNEEINLINVLPLSPPHSTDVQWTPNESNNPTGTKLRRGSDTLMRERQGSHNGGSPYASEALNERFFQESVILPSLNGTQTGNATPYPNDDEFGGRKAQIDQGASSVAEPQNSHWEYHGPGSFLSICSRLGMDWVAEKTGK